MRLPRDLSGEDLVKKLGDLGFEPTRQTGSHLRLTRPSADGAIHLTVPLHNNLRVGTLSAILGELARQLDEPKADLVQRLFG